MSRMRWVLTYTLWLEAEARHAETLRFADRKEAR